MKQRFYHGGAPDLTVISPPSLTGAPSLAEYGAGAVCHQDRVYITTSFEAACLFAAGHPSGRGMVYVVEPIYPLEIDTDCDQPGLSYACRKAKVLERIVIPAHARYQILKAVLA